MSFRALISAALMSVTLLTAVSASAVGETRLDNELQKLTNIINNSIPERYRDQLNAAVARVENAIVDETRQCNRRPPHRDGWDNGAEECQIGIAYGSYTITKNGSAMAQYITSLTAAISSYTKLQSAGLCSDRRSNLSCDLGMAYGSYTITRDGVTLAQYLTSQDAALDTILELRNIGYCR